MIDVSGAEAWSGDHPPPAALWGGRWLASRSVAAIAARSALLLPPYRSRCADWCTPLADQDIARVAGLLCGVGPGLTPSGDDALAGVLFVARLRWGVTAEPHCWPAWGRLAPPSRASPSWSGRRAASRWRRLTNCCWRPPTGVSTRPRGARSYWGRWVHPPALISAWGSSWPSTISRPRANHTTADTRRLSNPHGVGEWTPESRRRPVLPDLRPSEAAAGLDLRRLVSSPPARMGRVRDASVSNQIPMGGFAIPARSRAVVDRPSSVGTPGDTAHSRNGYGSHAAKLGTGARSSLRWVAGSSRCTWPAERWGCASDAGGRCGNGLHPRVGAGRSGRRSRPRRRRSAGR